MLLLIATAWAQGRLAERQRIGQRIIRDRNDHGLITGFFNGLYYEIAGEGHPLVLIHGGLVNSGLWDDQFEVFAGRYRTLRYDVRGFGQSKSPTSYYSNSR